jgi:hypothetical protein
MAAYISKRISRVPQMCEREGIDINFSIGSNLFGKYEAYVSLQCTYTVNRPVSRPGW